MGAFSDSNNQIKRALLSDKQERRLERQERKQEQERKKQEREYNLYNKEIALEELENAIILKFEDLGYNQSIIYFSSVENRKKTISATTKNDLQYKIAKDNFDKIYNKIAKIYKNDLQYQQTVNEPPPVTNTASSAVRVAKGVYELIKWFLQFVGVLLLLILGLGKFLSDLTPAQKKRYR